MRLVPKGSDWVRQSLGDGHTLAREILRVWDLAVGATYTAVPPGFPESALEHPEHGQGMVSRRRSDEALAALIAAPMPRLVVVEDALMRPDDLTFARHAHESFTFQNEVYHWHLMDGSAALEEVSSFLAQWLSYPFNAAVIQPTRNYEAREEVTRGELHLLATMVETVAVGAYDNEGYIVWKPERRFTEDWRHESSSVN